MKILCLCKRRPQGRDLFTHPYGRFYHLPRLLAERGHEVHLLLLSYQKEPPDYRQEGRLHIYSASAIPWGPLPYLAKAKRMAKIARADWVIGFSDTWYGILAEHVGRSLGTRALIDAYDNYESYMPWATPLHWLWRRALTKAAAVTAAGPQLAEWMSASAGGRSVAVVPMAADPNFAPLDKKMCRARLGLPLDAILVGYAGALDQSRGIELLFAVMAKLQAVKPQVELVLSGRLGRGLELPPAVHWLGYRPADEVPLIHNSLDLFFVLNKPGAFGDYSYPAKLYEAMACGVPVVAAGVAGTAWVLREHPEFLARAGDIDDFVTKASEALERTAVPDYRIDDWTYSADVLEAQLGL